MIHLLTYSLLLSLSVLGYSYQKPSTSTVSTMNTDAKVASMEQEIEKLKKIILLQDETIYKSPAIPSWFTTLRSKENFMAEVNNREWTDEIWRISDGGWKGRDYVHGKTAGVRVLDYYLMAPEADIQSSDFSLVGAVYFSERAESHKGLCHGGSMCALMDDVIGWLGFCSSGKLKSWEGFTVQIDTSLKKPVPIGSLFKVEANIVRREGTRKVFIKASLLNPETNELHCESNGLFLLPKE